MATPEFGVGSTTALRWRNRTRLLRLLRFSGPASRAQLARSAGLDAKTVTNLVNALLDEGLVTTGASTVHGRGRPAEIIRINAAAAAAVGVDVGSRQVTGVLLDLSGEVRCQRRDAFTTGRERARMLDTIGDIVADLLESADELGMARQLRGLGLVVPGFLDRSAGVVLRSVNIRGFRDVPIVEHMHSRFALPVWLEESSRSMALAEMWFGRQDPGGHFVCIDLGYGIGMGIIHCGQLYRGANETSGEIGHTVVVNDGPLCQCGKNGCLETVASGAGLVRLAPQAGVSPGQLRSRGVQAIVEAAVQGNDQARALLGRAGSYIGQAIANVINLFDPDHVIVNGGLVQAGDLLIEPLRQAVRQHTIGAGLHTDKISISSIGPTAGAMGAAMLPMAGYFDFDTEGAVRGERGR